MEQKRSPVNDSKDGPGPGRGKWPLWVPAGRAVVLLAGGVGDPCKERKPL